MRRDLPLVKSLVRASGRAIVFVPLLIVGCSDTSSHESPPELPVVRTAAASSAFPELMLADPVRAGPAPASPSATTDADDDGIVADRVKCDPDVVDSDVLVKAVLRRARSCKRRTKQGPVGQGWFELPFTVAKDGSVIAHDFEGGDGLRDWLLYCTQFGDYSFRLQPSERAATELRIRIRVSP